MCGQIRKGINSKITVNAFKCWWSHLSSQEGYIYTDYQLVKFLRWFDNRTNLVRSSNQPKNQDFLTINPGSGSKRTTLF